MTRPAPIIAMSAAALLLLFLAYMGSYYVLLKGQTNMGPRVIWLPRLAGEDDYGFYSPIYRLDRDCVELVFRPAYQLDRLIRPGYWGDE